MATTPPTFEQSVQELESIARKLSEGNLGLEQAVQLYERGMLLYAQCEKQLEQAAQQVKLLDAQAQVDADKDRSLGDGDDA